MKVKSAKSKKKSKKTKKVTKKAKSGKKKKIEINKHAGGKFKDFMRLEQETFGLTTERCGCTPEKECLDPEIEPIEFKDHQVHDGLDNEAELTLKPTETHNEENMEVSEEFRAKMEYMSRGFLGRLFYRIGKLFSKNKKPLGT